jgi:hypothetical protein
MRLSCRGPDVVVSHVFDEVLIERDLHLVEGLKPNAAAFDLEPD